MCRGGVTLAALQDGDHVIVIRRRGPEEYTAEAAGLARELRRGRCATVYGDSLVDHLCLEADDWPEIWPGRARPVLVAAIDGEAPELDRYGIRSPTGNPSNL